MLTDRKELNDEEKLKLATDRAEYYLHSGMSMYLTVPQVYSYLIEDKLSWGWDEDIPLLAQQLVFNWRFKQ